MINFMSSYQAVDRKGKHYHPKGVLCWYGCNQYGEMNGDIQIIKKVPEYVWIYDFASKGYQRLKREQSVAPKLNEIISKEPRGSPLETSNKKLTINQESQKAARRRRKDARKKDNRK